MKSYLFEGVEVVIYTDGNETILGPIQSEKDILKYYFLEGGNRKIEDYTRRVVQAENLSSLISGGSLIHPSFDEDERKVS